MTKKEWILMAAANACGGGHHHICAEDLKYIESMADLLDQKGYFDKPTEN